MFELVQPHGGSLVDLYADAEEIIAQKEKAKSEPSIWLPFPNK